MIDWFLLFLPEQTSDLLLLTCRAPLVDQQWRRCARRRCTMLLVIISLVLFEKKNCPAIYLRQLRVSSCVILCALGQNRYLARI